MDLGFSTSESTMYKVAKISNDDDAIKLFVHNTDRQSEKYGQFFLVIGDEVYIQDEETFSIDPTTIEEAFSVVSNEPEKALELFKSTIDVVLRQ